MGNIAVLAFAAAVASAAHGLASGADPRTVCTITVNSADEAETFRRHLPPDRYRFVELLQKGRADWLRSSCEQPVQCDVLLISGHFNAGDTFYSDRVGSGDHLAVDELERASCSNSCPGLFSRLKEVYLFGCESLNADASRYSSSQGDSGLARMRRIFAGVPVIYGFSASAPVGPTAAMLLERHFAAAPTEIGAGRASPRLLALFARNHMTATRGVDTGAEVRRQICPFFDERLLAAQKGVFIHGLLRGGMVELRASLERIDRLLAGIREEERRAPGFVLAMAAIAADDASRLRYLGAARTTPDAFIRWKMIALAQALGWLSPEGRVAEIAAMVGEVLAARTVGLPEVELICAIDAAGELDGAPARDADAPARNGGAARAAALACLGSGAARAEVLAALSSANEGEVQVAQVYLRHRPVSEAAELRAMAKRITRMPGTKAQVRAFDAFGRLAIDDREITQELQRAFASAVSPLVQSAIAEVLLRTGTRELDKPGLASVLRRHRIKSAGADDIIDRLIRHLQFPA